MREFPCLTPDQLQSLLAGECSAEEQKQYSQHIDRCTTCQQKLEWLASTSWEAKAKQLNAAESPETELQQVMEQALNPAAQRTLGQEKDAGDDLSFLEPPSTPEHLGRLDRYEVWELVGKGGFGLVFKAFDESLQRIVAIKVMSPELAATATARKRFTREARAAAAVSHDHVVGIHNVAEQHRPPYLVMEYVDGLSLQQKIDQQGPLELKEILRIGLQTAKGLAAAHQQGLVHRDIKPANILLENGVERVKLTDFGLARAADDASVTQSGVIAGTPMFMSPEQAEGKTVDARSDLFSLGSVLYMMATGRSPFRAEGTMAVMKRVIDDKPRSIREINPDMPEWFCSIVSKLHAKKPADRFESAEEVAKVLEQWLAHLQHPEQAPRPATVPLESDTTQTTEQETPSVYYLPATLALVVAIISLWFPWSWNITRLLDRGGSFTRIELGMLKPVQLGCEMWPGHFGFAPSNIRVFPLFLSITLTIAALVTAGRTFRLWWRAVAERRRPRAKVAPPTRPRIIYVLGVLDILAGMILLILCAWELFLSPDRVEVNFNSTMEQTLYRWWSVWESTMGYVAGAIFFAGGIGLLMWQSWARKMLVGVSMFALATLLIEIPLLLRYSVAVALAEAEFYGMMGRGSAQTAVIGLFVLFAAVFTLLIGYTIAQLVLLTRPSIIAAFAGQPPAESDNASSRLSPHWYTNLALFGGLVLVVALPLLAIVLDTGEWKPVSQEYQIAATLLTVASGILIGWLVLNHQRRWRIATVMILSLLALLSLYGTWCGPAFYRLAVGTSRIILHRDDSQPRMVLFRGKEIIADFYHEPGQRKCLDLEPGEYRLAVIPFQSFQLRRWRLRTWDVPVLPWPNPTTHVLPIQGDHVHHFAMAPGNVWHFETGSRRDKNLGVTWIKVFSRDPTFRVEVHQQVRDLEVPVLLADTKPIDSRKGTWSCLVTLPEGNYRKKIWHQGVLTQDEAFSLSGDQRLTWSLNTLPSSFTERAQRVIQLAEQEARRLKHNSLQADHIFLGLLREGQGMGAQTLKNLNLDLDKCRLLVERLIKPTSGKPRTENLPKTVSANRVIQHAVNEANHLRHHTVGTEHLLLGLLREPTAAAGVLLKKRDLSLERVRAEVRSVVRGSDSQSPPENANKIKPEVGPELTFAAGDMSWADRVVQVRFGQEAEQFKDTEKALGRPDRQFVSLGHGGELVLEFTDNVLVDGRGSDLVVFESGGESIDPFQVAISTDGQKWYPFNVSPTYAS